MISVRQHEQQLLEIEATRRRIDGGVLGLFKEGKQRVIERLRGGIV